MRTVSGLVATAREVHTQSQRAALHLDAGPGPAAATSIRRRPD